MTRRIVVTLKEDAVPETGRVAGVLAETQDMRVGFVMPGHGVVVGEVTGEMETSRIGAMREVSSVRIQASAPGKGKRAAG